MTINRLIALAAAVTSVAAGVPAARAQPGPRPIAPHVQVAPVKPRPGLNLPVTRNVLARVVAAPNRAVALGSDSSWDRVAPPSQIDYPQAALVVGRVRRFLQSSCAQFYDHVDLAQPRANGFRLISVSADTLAPPPGLALQSPVRLYTVIHASGQRTSDFAAADEIQILAPIHAQVVGEERKCWSGYSLSITLAGPAGVDPFGFQHPGGGGRPQR